MPGRRRAGGGGGVSAISYPRRDRRRWLPRRYHSVLWPLCVSSERNLFSALFSFLAIILLSTSLGSDRWLYLEEGGCPLDHLGVTWFYRLGTFQELTTSELSPTGPEPHARSHIRYRVGSQVKVDCVSPRIADLFHGLIGVCFVSLATAFVSFVLELVGPRNGFLKWLRRNSIFNIFTVVLCVLSVGLSYWTSVCVERLQRRTAEHPERVRVSFAEGFYLMVSAGLCAILSLTITLYKSSRQMKEEEERVNLLEESETDSESRRPELPPGSCGPPPPLGMILHVPPPPPYAP